MRSITKISLMSKFGLNFLLVGVCVDDWRKFATASDDYKIDVIPPLWEEIWLCDYLPDTFYKANGVAFELWDYLGRPKTREEFDEKYSNYSGF